MRRRIEEEKQADKRKREEEEEVDREAKDRRMAASIEQAMEVLNLSGNCTHEEVKEIFRQLGQEISDRATRQPESKNGTGSSSGKFDVCEAYSPPRQER